MIAREIAKECVILCFDEFQVTDIADAMILKNLYTNLFNHGVVLVATSNRHPDCLYENGIQRASFLPFIELLKERCLVYPLESGMDFRKVPQEHVPVFYRTNDPMASKALDAILNQLSNNEKGCFN